MAGKNKQNTKINVNVFKVNKTTKLFVNLLMRPILIIKAFDLTIELRLIFNDGQENAI